MVVGVLLFLVGAQVVVEVRDHVPVAVQVGLVELDLHHVEEEVGHLLVDLVGGFAQDPDGKLVGVSVLCLPMRWKKDGIVVPFFFLKN